MPFTAAASNSSAQTCIFVLRVL